MVPPRRSREEAHVNGARAGGRQVKRGGLAGALAPHQHAQRALAPGGRELLEGTDAELPPARVAQVQPEPSLLPRLRHARALGTVSVCSRASRRWKPPGRTTQPTAEWTRLVSAEMLP